MRPTPTAHQVFVAYDNPLAYQTTALLKSGRVTTTTFLRNWLRKNCPKAHKRVQAFPDDWNLPAIGEIWTFENLPTTMLFKLTFGGE